jgi:hypothetical protein
MNRLRDLKTPQMKLPPVLIDLFYDLRDRRLLPFVALVVVALVAVPFLLSARPSEPTESATAPPAPSSAGGEAQLTVVRTDHGLREPGKRLAHLSPKDPFEQHFTGPAGGGGEVAQTSSATSETTTTSTSSTESSSVTVEGGSGESSPPSGSGGASGAPSNGGASQPPITVFTFAIDLKIVETTPKPGGGKETGEPETKKRVLPATTLPGEKRQVLTYLGISPKHKKPLFLVSEDVSAVFGEADCVAGSANCQLLEAEPGFPLTLVYGPNDVRYKFTVLKVEPVATGHS